MLSRRTRARLDLFGTVVGLIILWYFRFEAKRYADIDREGLIESLDRTGTTESCANGTGEADTDVTTDDVKALFGSGLAEAGMADPIKPRWIAVGATESIVWALLFDHDVGGIRRSYRRRVIAIVLLYPYYQLRSRRDATWSIGVGRNVGTIVYRLKYGLLEDPPGRDADYFSGS